MCVCTTCAPHWHTQNPSQNEDEYDNAGRRGHAASTDSCEPGSVFPEDCTVFHFSHAKEEYLSVWKRWGVHWMRDWSEALVQTVRGWPPVPVASIGGHPEFTRVHPESSVNNAGWLIKACVNVSATQAISLSCSMIMKINCAISWWYWSIFSRLRAS